MNWKQLDSLIHDNYLMLEPAEVLEYSKQLLQSIQEDTKPLTAAKMTYVLVLLELKSKDCQIQKVLHYLQNLKTILDYECAESQLSQHRHAEAHELYVRKKADHYYHHIFTLAELFQIEEVIHKAHQCHRQNHQQLRKCYQHLQGFWSAYKKQLQKITWKKSLMTGFVASLALVLSWSAFWKVSDYLVLNWLVTDELTFSSELLQPLLVLVVSSTYLLSLLKKPTRASAEE